MNQADQSGAIWSRSTGSAYEQDEELENCARNQSGQRQTVITVFANPSQSECQRDQYDAQGAVKNNQRQKQEIKDLPAAARLRGAQKNQAAGQCQVPLHIRGGCVKLKGIG